MLVITILLSACGPVKPIVTDHVNQPLVFQHDVNVTYCKRWFGHKEYQVGDTEPWIEPLYCVVNNYVGTIKEGSYFHITHIEYNGNKTCFNPPDIVIDTGEFRGLKARLMYYPMQVANPGVHGCQFQLPFWVSPAGYEPPYMSQMIDLGTPSIF